MGMTSGWWRSARSAWAELGWLNGSLYAAGRLLSSIGLELYRYHLVAQPVPAGPLLPPHRGAQFQVRPIGRGDPAIATMPRPAQVIASRYDQGAVCLGAFDGARLIGFIWLQLGPYMEDEVHCRFLPGPVHQAGWDFDVYVDERYRVGPAFARLWDSANAYLRERGIIWTMSRISTFNMASVASHRRLRAHFLGSAVFVRGRSWQLMLATIAPFLHLGLGPRRYPEIRLRAPE